MNLMPPPETEDVKELKRWCDDLYEFLKYPVFGRMDVGDGDNYTTFANDGEINLVGTARVEKEIEIKAVSLAPGSTGPDAVILGNYLGYSYDINDDSVSDFEVPFDWAEGTDLTVKIYWYCNEDYALGDNNGEVQWQILWSAMPKDESELVDSPTHTGTIDYVDQNIPANAKELTSTAGGTIAGTSLSSGDMIGFTISRIALDGGNDPTADPVIVRIEIEYTSDTLGEAT